MVIVISLVAAAAGLFSLSYLKGSIGIGGGAIAFFTNLFVASMVLVVIVDNAFFFVLAWELMTITSYFLVISELEEEAVHAGFLYFFIAHGFSMLIMIAFFLLTVQTGSLDFATYRAANPPAWLASIVFLLALFGFGAKAGMIPIHSWLPRAHPAAPSHASALMSGVMVKLGIYGIIRVGVDFLGAELAWWGWTLVVFGAVSAVLGSFYTLAERDIKRLLAYSTVENVGIILMATGVAMVGIATGQRLVAFVGFLAALYHILNHAMFKGLLFLGAGALLKGLSTRDMTLMGGLGRRMPRTAFLFLIGALCIAAIPPLNGFVSEWFAYQSFFITGYGPGFAGRLLGPLAAMALAITGAVTLSCFVAAWGAIFGGEARSDRARQARETPASMLVGMGALALMCVGLGVGSPLVVRALGPAVAALSKGEGVAAADGLYVFPGKSRRRGRLHPARHGHDDRVACAAADRRRGVWPGGSSRAARRRGVGLRLPAHAADGGVPDGRDGAAPLLLRRALCAASLHRPLPPRRRRRARRPDALCGADRAALGPADGHAVAGCRQRGRRTLPGDRDGQPARLHLLHLPGAGRRPAVRDVGIVMEAASYILVGVAQAALLFLLAPLVTGVARVVRANSTTGAVRRSSRTITTSQSSWPAPRSCPLRRAPVFRATPYVFLVAMLMAAASIPGLVAGSPFGPAGDLLAVLYLFALARFFFALSGIDAGSIYGGLGASRETTLAVTNEPVMVLALFVVAARAGLDQPRRDVGKRVRRPRPGRRRDARGDVRLRLRDLRRDGQGPARFRRGRDRGAGRAADRIFRALARAPEMGAAPEAGRRGRPVPRHFFSPRRQRFARSPPARRRGGRSSR